MPRNPTHTTDDSSDESDRDHDVHPRGMRDNDQGRRTESQEPTSQEYEAQIRAFKEQIALSRGDIMVVGPRMYCRRGEGLNAMLINLNLDLTTN